jgi:hypothetical protein
VELEVLDVRVNQLEEVHESVFNLKGISQSLNKFMTPSKAFISYRIKIFGSIMQ